MKATTEAISSTPVLQEGGWQEVRRRRPYPTNWRHQPAPSPPASLPYQPYSRPTYAQVLLRNPTSMATANQTQHRSSPPNSPTSQTSTIYYVSPHSPSRLRFPPSHTFSEWKGRCFRCCRTGHSAAKCRNPKRCGKCWSYGHIGSKCKQDVVVPPLQTTLTQPKPVRQCEPGFEELLSGSYPYRSPEMPKERPLRVHCFLERDDEYFAELERLKRAVVMRTKGFQWELNVDNATTYACRTKLVNKEEIQVSELSGSRFLILLPEGLDPDTFINATPQEAWDEGLSFQPWSPLEDVGISIPAYKVLLRLVGVPPHLCREKHLIQAVSRFGVYLGSVQPDNPSSLASCLVAVGVDDLSLVPPELVLHIGGVTHDVQVYTLVYRRAPLYTTDDLPKQPKVYTRPQPPPLSSSSSDTDTKHDDHGLIHMSARVLRELCRGKTADDLLPELRHFATMEEIEMQHPDIATQFPTTQDQAASIQENQIISENIPIITLPAIKPSDIPKIDGVNQDASMSDIVTDLNEDHCHNKSADQNMRFSPINENSVLGLEGDMQLGVANHIEKEKSAVHANLGNSQLQKILLTGSSSRNLKPDILGVTNRRNSRPIPAAPVQTSNSMITRIPEKIESHVARDPILMIAPSTAENLPSGRGLGPRPNGVSNQAKNKGPLGASFKGPCASKYNWKKAPTVGPIKKMKEVVPLKRKNPPYPPPAPLKKISGKGKDKEAAAVSLNPDGFYEVKVSYDDISSLAAGCGFIIKEVEDAIQTDNEQRQIQAAKEVAAPEIPEPITEKLQEDYLDLGRFDLDSEDELTLDEGAY